MLGPPGPEDLAAVEQFVDERGVRGVPGPAPANLAALFAYAGPAMTDPTLLDRLGRLDLPAHVIWGEADRIVPPEYGRVLAKAIPGAHFTLLPEAGHLPQVEAPEQLLGAIWDLGSTDGQ